MQRTPVRSSNLYSVGYEPSLDILEVQFRTKDGGPGAVWQYLHVPQEIFEAMMADESIGSFFARRVRGKYEEVKISDAPKAEAIEPEASDIPPVEPVQPLRFVKKPVAVEAVQYTGENGQAIALWAKNAGGAIIIVLSESLLIRTTRGHSSAGIGDWIIREDQTNFRALNRADFDEAYEQIIAA